MNEVATNENNSKRIQPVRTKDTNHHVVKVILLANGVGGNPNTYRSNADESQWWNRRDALVRCVTAFLYCQTKTTTCNGSSSKELAILFDEDWTYLSMMMHPAIPVETAMTQQQQQQVTIPKESTIIQLWKVATQNPGIRIRQKDGLSCLCVTETSAVSTTTSASTTIITRDIDSIHNSRGCTVPSNNTSIDDDNNNNPNDTKRSVLEYLQSHCSIEFLREHKYVIDLDTYFCTWFV
jgi:hypothetical protein